MVTNYDKAREALDKLILWKKESVQFDRNEATTRFHLVDSLLLECLDWQKRDIQTEDRFEGEYTDYTISLARPVMILEAKRQSNYFVLADGTKGIEYSLENLCKDNPEFHKAIHQVLEYCNVRGVEIGVVSNGWQIAAFVANRLDGVPPMKGNAIVFSSLEKMASNFLEFWNLLSRHGFENKNLRNKLCGIILPDLPPKLSLSLTNYPGFKNRNQFQTNLQILSELVLEDVLRYQDLETIFLEECYCKAGALSNYSAVSKEILRTRYENLFETNKQEMQVQPAVDRSGIHQDFKNVAAHSISRRPILLIGDVGVGKSTFINHLIKIEAPEIFNDCITFKIDLGTKIILALDIRLAIINEIIRQLLDDYQIDIYEEDFVHGIYNVDFNRFKKGIYKAYFDSNHEKAIEKTVEFFEEKQSNKSEHLKTALYHLAKGRKKQIVIFIDNCDQRDYQTQQTSFLIAQEIAENWQPVTVFISLRPETFQNSLKKGALSGYLPKAFSISPPRVDLVIEKRLEFGRKIANGEIPLAQFDGQIGINLSSLKELIGILIYSFNKNKDLHRFIDNVCNGNIRVSIDIVKNFLGSGHIDTQKILNIYSDQGFYDISLHEFLRAVIFGNNIYYDPDSSYLVNLYDVHYNDPKEHFITLIMLGILESKSSTGVDNGFIETTKVSTHLQSVGYNIDQIDTALSIAVEKNLIETSARGLTFDRDKLPLSLRITPLGAYHLNNLCILFTYTDAILVDTPIFDENVREKIQDYNEIEHRLQRTLDFKTYLDRIWNDLADKPTFINWEKKSTALLEDINKIKTKIHFTNFKNSSRHHN